MEENNEKSYAKLLLGTQPKTYLNKSDISETTFPTQKGTLQKPHPNIELVL